VSSISKTITKPEDIQDGLQWAFSNIGKGLQGGAVVITLGRVGRTKSQNSKMWPMLEDLAKHVEWYGKRYDAEGWKDIITGSFKNLDFVPNTEGTGFVVVGMSTSGMSKAEFSDLIEFIYAFGASQEVQWSEPALAAYEQYRSKA
jgi:hypothetical protein